jgi:hypothetical protein
MLKRFQVLLEDWQAEYLRFIEEKYDLSFSEACRFIVSSGTLHTVQLSLPEYKTNLDKKNIKVYHDKKSSEVTKHQILSKVYFEARKAADYRIKKQGKKK